MCTLGAAIAIASSAVDTADAGNASGVSDPNSPLVIDPTSAGSTRTDPIAAGSSGLVMFVQRMPVTKAVTEVTLGDLRRDDGCFDSPDTSLIVREHPAGAAPEDGGATDINGSSVVAGSTERKILPLTPGKVTWSIPPTTLRKGRGYSFWIQSFFNACSTAWLTSWPHPGTDVSNGGRRCDAVYSSYGYRMWHEFGEGDAVVCPSWAGDTPSGFDPDMPSGWLQIGTSGDNYVQTVNEPQGSGGHCLFEDQQFRKIPWRITRDDTTPPWEESVCYWSGYAAFGADTPSDGWFYAFGALPKAAPWRDAYLRLDTIDYDALLRAYAPELRYADQETYLAGSPRMQTDNYFASGLLSDSNQLQTASGTVIAAAAPGLGPAQLSLEFLGEQYPPGTDPPPGGAAADTDKIDERNSYQADNDRMQTQLPEIYADKAYARVAYDNDGRLWLQYYFYYYYNSQDSPVPTVDDVHEGDWEMIQVGLDENRQPFTATYGRHRTENSGRCPWAAVQKAGPALSNPIVYVANGGHGNYFSAVTWNRFPLPDDVADGGGPITIPELEFIGEATPWASWPGNWSGSESTVRGPGASGRKWNSPDLLNSESPITADCEYNGRAGARTAARPQAVSLRLAPNPLRIQRAVRRQRAVVVRFAAKRGRTVKSVTGVNVTVHPSSKLGTPRGKMIAMTGRRGTVRIALPYSPGPYKVKLSAVFKDGTSSTVTRRIVR